eukprot:Gb_34552 [translate_table: standard]
MWDKLGQLYESKSLINLILLRKKLYGLKMEDGESVVEHLNTFNTLINQLRSAGDEIKVEDQCICLLCSLLDSWDNLIVAISGSMKIIHLKMDVIVSLLLQEETRRRTTKPVRNVDALSIRGRRHKKSECKADVSEVKVESSAATTPSVEGSVDLATGLKIDAQEDIWLKDSRASFHMTPHREWFEDYSEGYCGRVFLGDNYYYDVVGKGKLKVQFSDGMLKYVNNVSHVPTQKSTLSEPIF